MARDHAELEQQCLHIARKLLAAGRVADLNGVSTEIGAGAVAFVQPLEKRLLRVERRLPHELRDPLLRAAESDQLRNRRRHQMGRVVHVQLVDRATSGERPVGDVATATHHRVPSIHHCIEVDDVNIVESRSARRRPALSDHRAGQEGCGALCVGGSSVITRSGSRDDDHSSRFDLFQQLPLEHRDADDLHEAQNRMVVRAGEFESFSGSQPERRVVPGVEKLRCPDRVALAVQHLQIDCGLRVLLRRCYRVDSHGSLRRAKKRRSDQAVAHRGRAVVGVGGTEVPVTVNERIPQ